MRRMLLPVVVAGVALSVITVSPVAAATPSVRPAAFDQAGPVLAERDSPYRSGLRVGFDAGRRDGWEDARRECRRHNRYGDRARIESRRGDYDRGWADGFERGYNVGFDQAADRFCHHRRW